jgi:hypothetical protein
VLFRGALVQVQKGEQKATTKVVAFLFLGQKRKVISVIQRGAGSSPEGRAKKAATFVWLFCYWGKKEK